MDVRRLLNAISRLMQAERYADATTVCQQVITAAPNSAFAYVVLGDIHRAQGHWAEAVEAYREAILLRPNHVEEIRLKLDEAIDALSRQKAPRTTATSAMSALNRLAGPRTTSVNKADKGHGDS